MEDVASYLKAVAPPPPVEEPKMKKHFVRNAATGNLKIVREASAASVADAFKKSKKKGGKTLAAEEPPTYDDSKLLQEIVQNKASLFHHPFLFLTGSKQLLLDEVKSLPTALFP